MKATLLQKSLRDKKHYFDPKVIPSIAYTEPEVAWVGKTEKECKQEGLNYEVAKFPWAASGRAIASECSEGMTKLIFDKDTHRCTWRCNRGF